MSDKKVINATTLESQCGSLITTIVYDDGSVFRGADGEWYQMGLPEESPNKAMNHVRAKLADLIKRSEKEENLL